jgi:imidazolonepropionase-like amidohydrolase
MSEQYPVRRVIHGLITTAIVWPGLLLAGGAPEIPGAHQRQPIAVVGGTVHPASGPDIPSGIVLFDAGKLVAVGKDVAIPENAVRVDAVGKHVYPGLMDAFTDMGLVEINSIRATVDQREGGSINPNVKAWVAVNPDSEIIPVTRSNGVLLTLTAPAGGLVSGRSAVIQLDGWTYEDLCLRMDIGLHVNWPSLGGGRGTETGGQPPASTRTSPLQPLRDVFETARAYQKARAADPGSHPRDSRCDAMLPVLERKIPLIVNADQWQQLESAVAFSVEQNVRLIVHGGYDAAECADLLKRHDVPVIVAGTYRLPLRTSDNYDAAFTLPDRLRQAGVKYCISSTGRFGATGVRNLPYHAAMAAAFGLPPDEALKSISLYPAQILGVADRVGSLEPGKDATLFIASGDPLETTTLVEAAYIQGRPVDLTDRHKRLWKKYEEKYRRTLSAN